MNEFKLFLFYFSFVVRVDALSLTSADVCLSDILKKYVRFTRALIAGVLQNKNNEK